jgi:hypothetical protein
VSKDDQISIIFLNDAAGERDVGTVEHITFAQKEIFSKLYVFPIYEQTPSKSLHKNVHINTVAVFKRIFYQPFRPDWVLVYRKTEILPFFISTTTSSCQNLHQNSNI